MPRQTNGQYVVTLQYANHTIQTFSRVRHIEFSQDNIDYLHITTASDAMVAEYKLKTERLLEIHMQKMYDSATS